MQNNVGQEAGTETSAPSEGEGMGGLTGVPQPPQELGVTGTGGGNIGTGNIPQSGEAEFSGTPRAVGE